MLYPSLWTPGHFGLDDPASNPHQVIAKSLNALKELLKDIPADPRIRPWLQAGDWTPAPSYERKQIQAQFLAAANQGIYDWTLWQYDGDYDPTAIVNFPR